MAFRVSTESLAAASARRPWLVIGAWAVLFAVSVFLIVTLLGDALTTENRITNNPESQRADAILEEWRGVTHDNEIIIVQSETLTADDAAFQAHAEELFAGISALPKDVVLGGTNYYLTGDESLVSADRHITIMPFVMADDEIDFDDNISQALGAGAGRDGDPGRS